MPQLRHPQDASLLGCGSCWLELLSVFCQSPTGCAAPSSAQKCFPAFGGLGAGCGWLRAICTSGPAAATPAQRGAKRRVCISRGMKSRIRGPAGPLPFTRKGYAASVRRQSRQRLRSGFPSRGSGVPAKFGQGSDSGARRAAFPMTTPDFHRNSTCGYAVVRLHGAPAEAQRSGFGGERRRSGTSEPCLPEQGEGCGACVDDSAPGRRLAGYWKHF